jgi:adenylate cyclase
VGLRVEDLNTDRPPGRPELRIGIGIHTGPPTAGTVGSRDRLEYSVIGETVPLAETRVRGFEGTIEVYTVPKQVPAAARSAGGQRAT